MITQEESIPYGIDGISHLKPEIRPLAFYYMSIASKKSRGGWRGKLRGHRHLDPFGWAKKEYAEILKDLEKSKAPKLEKK